MTFKEMLGINRSNGTIVNGTNNEQVNNLGTVNKISKDMFVDAQKPLKSINNVQNDEFESPLKIVLEKRWYAFGYDDGYAAANAEKKDVRIEAIISEIVLVVSKTIELLKNEQEKISNQLILLNADEKMSVTTRQLELKRNGLIEKIDELKNELENIYERKGVFSKPISDYVNGFSEGVNDKVKRDLLGKNLNIF